jgi:putative tryptophan/tyrosine transport system substrate-binding protein
MRFSNRRRLLLAVLVLLGLVFLAVIILIPPPPPSVITVGVVNYRSATEPTLDGFKAGMEEYGYHEGENIQYIYGGPVETIEELRGVADGFVAADVDLILGIASAAASEAKKATDGTDIPLVFAPVTDPQGSGLVNTLEHPGGNVTGVTNGGSEPRRLEWLLELAPEIKRVFVPYNPDDPSPRAALDSAQTAAAELGIELVLYEARDDAAMVAAAANIPSDVDALFMLPDSLAIAHTNDFVAATLARNLPFSSPTGEQVRQGALVAFGINFYEAGRQAARLADQILRGQDPADLPVEEAEFFLTINLETADAIGLPISDEILNQASDLIRD